MKGINLLILITILSMSMTVYSQNTSTIFEPAKDNTIFNDGIGTNSNGSGDYIFQQESLMYRI